MNRIAIRLIGQSLIVALLFVAVGAALFWFSHDYSRQVTQAQESVKRKLADVDNRYRHTMTEEPLVRETIHRFEELRQRGFIGSESRLDWAAQMRAIGNRLQLQDLSFSLGPQQAENGSSGGGFPVKISRMNWRARLLHEGDLLRALAALHEIPNAMVLPRRCTIAETRAPFSDASAPAAIEYSLTAECELDWITIEDKSVAKQSSEPPP